MTVTVNKIADTVNQLIDANEAVAKATASLKELTEDARRLREETIPSLMQEAGIMEVTLPNGKKVSIKQDVFASIPKGTTEAYEWLDKNGFGGIIKTSVSVDFARGLKEQAANLANELSREGYNPSLSESVHSSTLKAFLRDELEKGTPIPMELFNAHPVLTTVIKER